MDDPVAFSGPSSLVLFQLFDCNERMRRTLRLSNFRTVLKAYSSYCYSLQTCSSALGQWWQMPLMSIASTAIPIYSTLPADSIAFQDDVTLSPDPPLAGDNN